MYTILYIGALCVGGVILYLGAELLIKGSAGLARALGVKPLVIGLTVVAYGTSAPELAVSTAAILDDASAIVLGNVIGSCIANLGLILGLAALIAPPAVDGQLIRREIPVLCLSAAIVPLVLLNGRISLLEAAGLVLGAVAFTVHALLTALLPVGRATTASGTAAAPAAGVPEARTATEGDLSRGITTTGMLENSANKLRLGLLSFVGLVLLVVGSEVFIKGARGLANSLGWSERFIGLTVVALGTSLPELAASLVAALRGYSSLAVGNVVGANIFNVLMILGVVGTIRPIRGSLDILAVDLGFLIGLTVLGVLFMRGARTMRRTEGLILIGAYVAFLVITRLGW